MSRIKIKVPCLVLQNPVPRYITNACISAVPENAKTRKSIVDIDGPDIYKPPLGAEGKKGSLHKKTVPRPYMDGPHAGCKSA